MAGDEARAEHDGWTMFEEQWQRLVVIEDKRESRSMPSLLFWGRTSLYNVAVLVGTYAIHFVSGRSDSGRKERNCPSHFFLATSFVWPTKDRNHN